jgi:hypothetical protein
MNNVQATLVELKINIERAASTARPVVREIYLRKSLELIEAALKRATKNTGKPVGVGKAAQSVSDAPELFPAAEERERELAEDALDTEQAERELASHRNAQHRVLWG